MVDHRVIHLHLSVQHQHRQPVRNRPGLERDNLRIAPHLFRQRGGIGAQERERDVVLGLLQGGSNKSIGLMLKLSPRTVEFHRAKLMRRFGAKSLMGLRAAILLDAAPPASDKR